MTGGELVLWVSGILFAAAGVSILVAGLRKHDGKEPDSRPVNLQAPDDEEKAIMAHQDICFIQWRNMNGPEQAAARDAYYTAKRF